MHSSSYSINLLRTIDLLRWRIFINRHGYSYTHTKHFFPSAVVPTNVKQLKPRQQLIEKILIDALQVMLTERVVFIIKQRAAPKELLQ